MLRKLTSAQRYETLAEHTLDPKPSITAAAGDDRQNLPEKTSGAECFALDAACAAA
jgi:hypothetical protein